MYNKRKQILFVCYGLGVGGIEKCFVNLLNVLPEQYDIDVLLMNPYHTFKDQIKRNVNFLNEFDYVMNIHDTIPEIKKRGGILRNLGMFISYCIFRLRIKFHKNAWRGFKKVPKQYDVAIAYSHHDFSPYYVIDKVSATKKCLWYHNGAYEHQGLLYERDKEYFPKFEKVVAVSTDCAKVLSEKFQFNENQLVVLKNICDSADILMKAKEGMSTIFDSEFFHIVTVGRMTAEKGALMAVEVCRQVYNQGIKIKWHWIGDGYQAEYVKKNIKDYGLEEVFILEGNQNNPYPFMNAADIYVQPSLYEAYSTTVTEAKVLKKPIITTDVGGMRDQLIHEKNGLIVPIEARSIANSILRLMRDEELRKNLCSQLEKECYKKEESLREYEKLIFS